MTDLTVILEVQWCQSSAAKDHSRDFNYLERAHFHCRSLNDFLRNLTMIFKELQLFIVKDSFNSLFFQNRKKKVQICSAESRVRFVKKVENLIK